MFAGGCFAFTIVHGRIVEQPHADQHHIRRLKLEFRRSL
jgi:hypothetical protein